MIVAGEGVVSVDMWLAFLTVALISTTLATSVRYNIMKYDGLENCVPGHLVWVNCNLCTCNKLGRPNAVCSRMWCQPVPNTPTVDAKELFKDYE